MIYQFDHFEIDTENFELRHDGKTCHVEPLVFDLLCFFSENPGRVIEKDEIIQHVWKGRIVSDATVSSCIKASRKALGDSGEQQAYIKTVRGRGFQFTADVLPVVSEKLALNSENAIKLNNSNKTKPLPSLVILPFQVFGDEEELSPVADGLVENLTTILTRVPLLSVASRTSSFSLKGKEISPQTVREKFSATYMFEGSVQKMADSVRLNVQLIETHNGFHLWARQFDEPHSPDVMMNLLSSCLSHLETHLVKAIFNDLSNESGELSSRQLLAQACSLLSVKGWHRDSFKEAAVLLRRSIAMEPDIALSHAYLALILGLGQNLGLLEKTDKLVEEAIKEAEIALELDNMDSNVLGIASCALSDVGLTERAIPIFMKSTELNPNNAQAWAGLGVAEIMSGNVDRGIECLQHGISISPLDSRLSMWWSSLSLAYLFKKDLDKALEAARKGCQSDDKNYIPRVALTAVLIKSDKHERAMQALRECYRVKPDLSQNEIIFLVGRKLEAVFGEMKSSLCKIN